MLLKAEAQSIQLWIVECFDQQDFKLFLARCGGYRLELFASTEQNMEVVAFNFLDWLRNHPEAIGPILAQAAQDYARRENFAPLCEVIVERWSQRQARACSPWDAVLVRDVPVADRTRLRQILRIVVRGRTHGVVTINGPSGSGRSHSWHLIHDVACECGHIAHKFDLAAFPIEDRTIETFYERIVGRLNLIAARPTTSGATANTVAIRFADALVDALNHDQRTFWLGFDSVDQKIVPEIRYFLAQVASSRLQRQPDRGMIFLLGADQDFGIDDKFRRVEFESLTAIEPKDFEAAAATINLLGDAGLDAISLQVWTQTAVSELGHLRGHQAGEFVRDKLLDLRDMIGAF